MVSQKCPRCASERIRRGYRPTPIWKKIVFRYNLLCDDCNWEYTGFAIPGTVSTKPTKRIRKLKLEETTKNLEPSRRDKKSDISAINEKTEAGSEMTKQDSPDHRQRKKRIKIKL